MKKPVIQKARNPEASRREERGVTMVLVATAMVAIVAMAALSIDVITLYLAREEAQRSADNAAIAAAKVISLSGLTGDPNNSSLYWGAVCGPDDGVNGLATRTAKAVAGQDTVGGIVATTVNVTYSAGNGSSVGAGTSDCTTLSSTAFGVNPMVTVQITRASLPTFFSRIWGNTGNTVSATATAEAFNSSDSGDTGNQTTGTIVPVQPRCVKPWVVPNSDPFNPSGCTPGSCTPFVDLTDGSIKHPGISLGGTGVNGVIGETFWMIPDCQSGANCALLPGPVQPQANYPTGVLYSPPNLLYVPGQVGTPVLAVPSCAAGNYEEAIAGCDQATNYSCGVAGAGNVVDTTISPALPTTNAVQCLTGQQDNANVTSSSGQDYLDDFAAPDSYPFRIRAGSKNPTGLSSSTLLSNSLSIVSLPIYDNSTATIGSNTQTNVTFVGFLQVFIDAVDANGNLKVTVLNVAGCSNNATGTSIVGNSPVPVRLITPP